ncbi:MAG: monovalent cation/H+ antiporter subunit E [Methanobacterium sp.]
MNIIFRMFYAIAYFIVLIKEIIKATFDVAMRTLNGKVEPVIVEIETELKRPISQVILANSITLTPGTLSIDVDSENCILKVATIVPRAKEDVIPFEPYIKGWLE